MLIFTIINQALSQEECSRIIIISTDRGKQNNETWAHGVNSIPLSLQHECNGSRVATISWSRNKFGNESAMTANENITFTNGSINKTYHEPFDLPLGSLRSANLTLHSSMMMDSYLVVQYENTTYAFQINLKYCTYNGANYTFNATRIQYCPNGSMCNSTNSLFPTTDKNCGRHANWNMHGQCPEVLNITMSEQNDKTNKDIPFGQKVNFLCDKTMMDASGRALATNTHQIKFTDHLKRYSCSEHSNDSTVQNTSIIIFNVTTKPHFSDHQQKNFKSSGGSVVIKIPFQANPYVEKDKIKIKYKDTNFTDFTLTRQGTTDIDHEITLFFEQVSNNNIGPYEISLSGTDGLCRPTIATLTVTLSKELHMGWIVSIVLGSLIFVIIVSISIYCIRYRRRNDSSKTNHKGMTNTNAKVNKPPAINMQPHHQGGTAGAAAAGAPALPERNNVSSGARQTQFQNPSNGYKSSDDEFDSDVSDYEKMTKNAGTIDNRPPMPLPPQQHGGRSPRHAHSGGHDNRNAGFPTTSQGPALPSPRNVPPPPPQNRGRMPPPARSAAAPLPPPPHQTGYPGGRGYGY